MQQLLTLLFQLSTAFHFVTFSQYLFIEPYRVYRFQTHLSIRFYRASIKKNIGQPIETIYRFPQEFAGMSVI